MAPPPPPPPVEDPAGFPLVIGCDTETHLIAAGDICPRLVVSTFDAAPPNQDAGQLVTAPSPRAWGVGNGDPELVQQLLDVFQECYRRRAVMPIHNLSFDICVFLRYAADVLSGAQVGPPGLGRELYLLIWDVLDRNLDDEWKGLQPSLTCTLIREKLWYLSMFGNMATYRGRDIRYGLSDLVQTYFNVDISDSKVTMDAQGRVFDHTGADITGTPAAASSWRLRFKQLDGVPLAHWPPEALAYAISDSTWARKVYCSQEANRRPAGPGSMNSQSLQAYADVSLRLMSATGFRLDRDRVRKLEATIDAKLASVRQLLQLNGIERPNETINTAVVQERITAAWAKLGRHPMLTDTGRISTSAEVLVELEGVDPILDLYNERQDVIKTKTSFLPNIRGAVVYSNYDILKETGRCSSYGSSDKSTRKPLYDAVNIQQMPRADGVRECFMPPEGFLMCSCDYSALELCSVAQVTYMLFGASKHREKNLQGIDLHAYLGASMAMTLAPQVVDEATNADDAVAVLMRKLKTKEPPAEDLSPVAEAIRLGRKAGKFWRNNAKPVGLGYPGGLGPATQVRFAKATYGVDMTEDQARTFRDIWRATYPEMVEYFRWVERQVDAQNTASDGGELYCYETPGFRRFRSGTPFCSTANGMAMQSLSADGAKRSVCWLVRAMSGGLRPEDPFSLLGDCYPLAFIHDENLAAIPDDELATERALLMSRLMVLAMQVHMPDVRISAEPAFMRRWSKDAGDAEWRTVAGRGSRVYQALEARGRGFADAVADAIGPGYDPDRQLIPWHDLHPEKA